MVSMYDQAKLAQLAESHDRWEETTLHQTLARAPERKERFVTTSGEIVGTATAVSGAF